MPTLLTLDTCVLMHSFTRHLFLRLAQKNLCTLAWSEQIGKEWQRNAPRIWNVEPSVVQEEWLHINQQFPLANMGLIEIIEGEFRRVDKKDRHVALCAQFAQQRYQQDNSLLITWNIKDFHKRELREQGIMLQTPDQYLSDLWRTHQDVLRHQLQLGLDEHLALGRPEYSLVELLKRDKLFRLKNMYQASQANV